MMTGDEAVAAAIRAGCNAGFESDRACLYPDCRCRTKPVMFRAAIAEYSFWRASTMRGTLTAPPASAREE